MEARELRIGNLVYSVNRKGDVHLLEEVPLVVIDIAQSFVKTYPLGMSLPKVLRYNPFSIRDITPISLTEEWLVRFGFKNVEDNTFDIEISVPERYLSIVKDCNKNDYRVYVGSQVEWVQCTRIKHVHQLQNLYFALTGQELELIK